MSASRAAILAASLLRAAAATNDIVAENLLPGSASDHWDVNGAGCPAVRGYITVSSALPGETVDLKMKIDAGERLRRWAPSRLRTAGARRRRAVGWRADASPKAVDLQHAVAGRDPALPPDGSLPHATAPGGRTRRDGFGSRARRSFFVVRSRKRGDLVFQTADLTWHAYNGYGGYTTYGAFTYPFLHEPFDKQFMNLSDPSHATKRAYKRSLNTPVITRDYRSVNAPFGAELAAIRFLERNGYDGDARTMVIYKETQSLEKLDAPGEWTGTFRDARAVNPRGAMPENALTGTMFAANAQRVDPVVLDGARFGAHRAWRGTAVRTGKQTRVALAGVLGHEWDEVVDNGASPPLLQKLSETSVDNVQCIMDHGATFDSGSATHNLWAWALDATHDANDPQRANKYNIRVEEDARGPDRDLQQLTVNVFQDMGVLPATLDPTLRLVHDAVDDEPPAVTLSSAAVVGGVAVLSAARRTLNVGAVEVSWSPGRWHLATLDRIAPDVTWSLRWGDEPGAPPRRRRPRSAPSTSADDPATRRGAVASRPAPSIGKFDARGGARASSSRSAPGTAARRRPSQQRPPSSTGRLAAPQSPSSRAAASRTPPPLT
ncbi:hypothetical protein JL720_9640 [Aureococcus anophagefferens]|nr:hypothetical protein JL720_9640 [Aureococcus anophagefferens]